MILYNEFADEIDFDIDNAKLIKNGELGSTSNLYYYNSDCIKILSPQFLSPNISNVIKKVKEINNPNLYKIYDLCYSNNNSYQSSDNLIAYITKYYEASNLDVIETSMEYLTDNFIDLLNLADVFAKNGLEIEDLHLENIILQDNRIILIDADDYNLEEHLYEEIIEYIRVNNTVSLRVLLYSIFEEILRRIFHNEDELTYYRNVLRRNILHNVNNSLDQILKDLSNYKYPIEYIKQPKYVKKL